MAFFPMFVDLTDEKCLVVGGGRIALRKVQVLLDFDASVLVVAREISKEIKALLPENKALSLEEREFKQEDIEGCVMVVVATNDEEFNERISKLCRSRNIPVNVVDDKEKCSFIFSSYVKEKNVVGAFTSGGSSPVLAQYLKKKTEDFLTPEIGDLGEVFGSQRAYILENIKDENQRKSIFMHFIHETVSAGRAPESKEITEYIDGIKETDSRQ